MLQIVTECYKLLQSVTECYTVLQSVTEYNRVLQNITEYYRVFLAHLFGPISGLVDDDFDAEDDYDGIAGRGRGVVWVW